MDDAKKYRPKGLTYKVHLAGGQDRLAEAILYIAEAYKTAERFGLIKLNKTLWRADFTAFATQKIPVTGREYQKLKYGPAPIEMMPVLRRLQETNAIEIDRVKLSDDMVEHRVYALMPANRRFFSQNDLEFLDAAIQYYWDKTGMEASDDSHDVGWKTREIGDEMPYELAFLSDEELDAAALSKFEKIGAGNWSSA